MIGELVILVQPGLAHAMERMLQASTGERRHRVESLPSWFFDDEPFRSLADVEECFARVEVVLAQYAPAKLRHLTVFVGVEVRLPTDAGSRSRWNPLLVFDESREKGGYRREQLLSWLVLAWPEVRWTFLRPRGMEPEPDGNPRGVPHPHYFLSILDPYLRSGDEFGISTLFDPAGMRDGIRRSCGVSPQDARLPHWKRGKTALVVDEEEDYATLHGYVAYRAGFRCWTVGTLGLFRGLLGSDNSTTARNSGSRGEHLLGSQGLAMPTVSLEDRYLGFPDKSDDVRLSNDEDRPAALRSVPHRYLVTVGHSQAGSGGRSQIHPQHWQHCERIIYKPTRGMHDLQSQAQLGYWAESDRFDHTGISVVKHGLRRAAAEIARGLQSLRNSSERLTGLPGDPRVLEPPNNRGISRGRHSAPGRLMKIAQGLLERAETLGKDANSTCEALHSALLALEAKELLQGMTPTLSLQALALQNRMEVTAECECLGVEYEVNLKRRFQEIADSVRRICRFFRAGRERRQAEISAQTAIIGDMAGVFRDYSHFDEEMLCLARLRHLHARSVVNRHPQWWILYPAHVYVNFLLSSIPTFALAVFTWFVAFTWALHLWQPQGQLADDVKRTLDMMLFLNAEGTEVPTSLRLAAEAIGLVHVGVLLSHVYSLALRR